MRLRALCLLLPLLVATAAAAHDRQGYLHGRVLLRNGGEYAGLMRWGDQEVFWDDLFNATKAHTPWLERMEDRLDRKTAEIKVFGWKVRVGEGAATGRTFQCRFGDMEKIVVTGDQKAEVHLKGGAVIEVDGGSDDVGGKIQVLDPSLGAIAVRWDRIEEIRFSPTPSDLRPEGQRLYGRMDCDAGVFDGWIQWDSQECLATDKLDGESRDGEVSLAMGSLRSIERRSGRGADVVLKDGRRLSLRGSNDVNDENRGIYVEVDGLYRLRVMWDEFERLDLAERRDSGPGYDDYAPGERLRGVVLDREGRRHAGLLVMDLDEEWSFELLDGRRYGVEYHIPLARVSSLEPSGDRTRVGLRGGESLVLEEGQDVGENNAGVLVLDDEDDDDPLYLSWDEIEHIELEP